MYLLVFFYLYLHYFHAILLVFFDVRNYDHREGEIWHQELRCAGISSSEQTFFF